MLEQLAQEPLFDESQIALLRDALGEDELREMFADLPEAAQRSLEAIQAALEANDLEQAKRAAHVLKGVASSFGAARLALIAREIELELPTVASIAQSVPVLMAALNDTSASLPGGSEGSTGGAR
ncbi:Hpt domain-containing protein [Bradyrhizobium sp.]|uniref:Hpt domain-containing protein n=1 Tax=Bradyrhizobium sp. TaxID=376 RepID=UPI003C5DBE44